MNVWDGVLWLAFATGVVALVLEVIGTRRPGAWADWARRSTIATAALLTVSFLFLCLLFLALDLSVEYVWTYTADWVSWPYRLAGAWTGREGSLLLWTAAMAGVAAVMSHRQHRDNTPHSASMRIVMLALLGLFLLAVARQGTFSPTPDFFLAGRPGGNGINPTLRSPFILIHPPMMFIAYALTIVPASAGIAHMVTGAGQWSRIAARATRLDWVLYTFAMGLGGIWAYFTLGFGGYWAWDPVEVANLLPWLALTIFVHAQMMHARRGDFSAIGPMLAVIPFVLTVFSTVSTRSGLWVSVHAFTDPTNAFNPDAAGRLLGILGIDASLAPYFGILLGTLLVAAGLWCRRLSLELDALPRSSRVIAAVLGTAGVLAAMAPTAFLSLVFEAAAWTGHVGFASLSLLIGAFVAAAAPMLWGEGETTNRGHWISVRGLAALSVLLLSLGLVTSILWHFGAVNGWSEAFWDARVPWISTPLALALVLLLTHAAHGRRRALELAGGALAVALLALAWFGLGGYSIVLGSAVLVAGIDKMVHVGFVGDRTARAGSLFLWLGALLNVVFWFNPPAAVVFGGFEPRWPVQVPMGLLALGSLVGAHMVAGGKSARWPYLLVAALGAYYIAPVLALGAYFLHRRSGVPAKAWSKPRARMVAVYGVHLVVGLLFVGYAASTYFEQTMSGEFAAGEPFQIGPHEGQVIWAGTEGGPFVDEFTVQFSADGERAERTASATMAYESAAGAYYPLPAALRAWHGDLYLQLDAVCFEAPADCTQWIAAYESDFPARDQGTPQGFRITAHSLPGVGLVWASLALFVFYGLPIALVRDSAVPTPKPSREPTPRES